MSEKHICPPIKYGMMPIIIQDHALQGNTEAVLEWLENGGDASATNKVNSTVVVLAAWKNQSHLLRALLARPDVHLNQGRSNSFNSAIGLLPLETAVREGHMECVDALLSAPSECKVALDGNDPCLKNVVMIAASNKRWLIIRKLLDAGLVLHEKEATQIFYLAAENGDMETVKAIIDKKIPIYVTGEKSKNALMEIYTKGHWDYVGANEIFKKGIKKNNYSYLQIPHLALERQDFKLTETLMNILTPNVSINISLAEAILEKDLIVMEEFLSKENLSDDILSGALLIGATGGTSDAIVRKLTGFRDSYPEEVLEFTLLLAATKDRTEWFPALLKKQSFSYSVLCHANSLSKNILVLHLIHDAVMEVIKETLGLDKKSINNADDFAAKDGGNIVLPIASTEDTSLPSVGIREANDNSKDSSSDDDDDDDDDEE